MRHTDGQAIVKQGACTTFYVIKEGEAAITIHEDTPREKELTHIYPGDYFGETALNYGSKRTATVRAVGNCVCGVLDQKEFERLSEIRGFLLLQKCDLVKQLTRRQQMSVLNRLRPLEFSSGATVIREGDAVEMDDFGMYIITKGELDVVDAKRGRLASIYQGHSFGELALINSAPRAASVVAKTDVRCLALLKRDFLSIGEDAPGEADRANEPDTMGVF